MLHLLKIEWMKVCRYKAFLILLGLFILSIFGLSYIVYEMVPEGGDVLSTLAKPHFQFPKVWHLITYLSSYLLFIPGLIIILLICNEYSFKTHRQNIIDGISRSQFINTKLILIVFIALGTTLIVSLVAGIFGLMVGGEFTFSGMEYLFYFFLQSILYMLVAAVFALLFKRSGISIGIYFLYNLILENLLASLINRSFRPVGSFLPLESSDSLNSLPVSLGLNLTQTSETSLIISCFVWITLLTIFCKWKFEKHDL